MIIIIIIIIPWSRVLPENVQGPELSKKFPAFYGTQRFITTFKTARHLSLSRARSIHFVAPSHLLKIYYNIIVTFRTRSSKWSLCIISPHKNSVCTSHASHTCHMPHPSHSFDHPNNTEHFTMFSVITNIYNKKTKGPTLMELFTATGKLKSLFFDNYRCSMCAPRVTWHTYSSCCHTRVNI